MHIIQHRTYLIDLGTAQSVHTYAQNVGASQQQAEERWCIWVYRWKEEDPLMAQIALARGRFSLDLLLSERDASSLPAQLHLPQHLSNKSYEISEPLFNYRGSVDCILRKIQHCIK